MEVGVVVAETQGNGLKDTPDFGVIKGLRKLRKGGELLLEELRERAEKRGKWIPEHGKISRQEDDPDGLNPFRA